MCSIYEQFLGAHTLRKTKIRVAFSRLRPSWNGNTRPLIDESKWPAAGQGLQITKWPAVQLFPKYLEIYKSLSNKTLLYLLEITKRFY